VDECDLVKVYSRYSHKIFGKEKEKIKENRKSFDFFFQTHANIHNGKMHMLDQ